MRRRNAHLKLAAAAVVAAITATGCSSGSSADKAGGSSAPVLLHMAVQVSPGTIGDGQIIEDFARAAHEVSNGKLRVDVAWDASGDATATPEQDIARMVESGRFDLGFIGARAWDELGVDSLRALLTPFLIDNAPLLGAVARSPIAEQSLAGLPKAGVVGVGLVPIELRHVFARKPVLSPADYAGLRIRNFPSRTTDALFTALGAVPVHPRLGEAFPLIADGKIDAGDAGGGLHPDLNTFSEVVLFPKYDTLVANGRAYKRLSGKQRSWLRQAAARTVDRAISKYVWSEAKLVHVWCRNGGGRVIAPSPAQLAALHRAAAPVTADLERDPQTKSLIAQISRLKASTSPGPRVVVPPACSAAKRGLASPVPDQPSANRTSTVLDGTYRYVLTKADARTHGTPGDRSPDNLKTYPLVFTWVLRHGTWQNQGGDRGTFVLRGNRLVFNWKTQSSVLRFSFTRDADGTLHLTPLGRFDPGDRYIWATKPWRRVGPPSLRALKQP